MLPGNADEAFLAAQFVGARRYGMDCIRLARGFTEMDQMCARKCGVAEHSARRVGNPVPGACTPSVCIRGCSFLLLPSRRTLSPREMLSHQSRQ
jgi:hypothetical protein